MHIAQLNLPIGDAANTVGIPGADQAAAPDGGFGAFLSQLIVAIFAIAVLLVLLYLIWGAIQWITSGGDKGKVETARNRMTQSVIGLLVLASVFVIMAILQSFLGYELFNIIGGNDRGKSLDDKLGKQGQQQQTNPLQDALGGNPGGSKKQ